MDDFGFESSIGGLQDVLIFKNNLDRYMQKIESKKSKKKPSKSSLKNLVKELAHREDIKIVDFNEAEDFIRKACIFIAYTIGSDDFYAEDIDNVFESGRDKYDSIINTELYKKVLDVGFYTLFPSKKIDNCVKLYKILMYNDLVSSDYIKGDSRIKPFADVQKIVKNKNKKFYNYAIQSINKGTPAEYVKYFLGNKVEEGHTHEEITLLMSSTPRLREKSALNLIFTFANNLDAIKELGVLSVLDENFTENYTLQIKTQTSSRMAFEESIEEIKKAFKSLSEASYECFNVDVSNATSIEEICISFHSKAKQGSDDNYANETIILSQMTFSQIYGISAQHERISEDDLWVFISSIINIGEMLNNTHKIDVPSDKKDVKTAFIISYAFIKMYQESDNTLNSKGTHLYREQITQLQASNEELQVNYIRMKDDKNDEINRLDKIIKEHTKEVNRISLQHEKEVKKLNKKIDEYKKMEQELEALREFMQASNQEEQVVRFDMDKALEEINKRPVIMIGGFAKWVDKVREVIPHLKHLSADELGRSYNAIRDENAIVLFHAGYNNHGSYYKFINNINNGAKLIYLNTGSNIELLIKRIYDKLQ